MLRATEEIENIPEDKSFKKIPILSVSKFPPPSSPVLVVTLSYLFNFSSIYPFILVLGEEKMLVSFLALLETENKLRLTELCLPCYIPSFLFTFALRSPLVLLILFIRLLLTTLSNSIDAEIHFHPKLNFILFPLLFFILYPKFVVEFPYLRRM